MNRPVVAFHGDDGDRMPEGISGGKVGSELPPLGECVVDGHNF